MNPNPKVSIVTATYNRPQLIGQAVKSALAQSFSGWEMIVVNDAEDDGTSEIMAEWQKKDPRIKYFVIPRCGRIAAVSNFALRQANGEYIAILDDDDYWAAPEKLAEQARFLDENPDCAACGGGAIAVDENGRELFKFLKPERDEQIKKQALYANPMINSAALFRRSVAEEVGFYDESLAQFADWDFWLKMGLKGKLYNFQEYFLYYRVWEKGSSFSHQKENARSARAIVKRYRGRYPNFFKALIFAYLYTIYAYLPSIVKNFFNPLFSRLKKSAAEELS